VLQARILQPLGLMHTAFPTTMALPARSRARVLVPQGQAAGRHDGE
jgi:hypothetical protein